MSSPFDDEKRDSDLHDHLEPTKEVEADEDSEQESEGRATEDGFGDLEGDAWLAFGDIVFVLRFRQDGGRVTSDTFLFIVTDTCSVMLLPPAAHSDFSDLPVYIMIGVPYT